MKENISKLVFYSLGIVVVDKPNDSDEVEVTPIEDIPNISSVYKDYKPKFEVELPDARGVKRKSMIIGKSTIKAKWLPLNNSNRITSPNVIKNETIMLYRYADSEDYYWNTMFHEPKIRRLEKVRYAFGNKSKPLEEWNHESSYWFEVSTLKGEKWVRMHISNNDYEMSGYDVTFNARTGVFSVEDTHGNFVKMDSVNGVYHVKMNNIIVLEAPFVIVKGALIH
jgi:hypothetical protein